MTGAARAVHPITPLPSPRGDGHDAGLVSRRRTARPVPKPAGGDPFALTDLSGCARTQPGAGGAIHLTTGRTAVRMPLLEGRLPVVTSHPSLQP